MTTGKPKSELKKGDSYKALKSDIVNNPTLVKMGKGLNNSLNTFGNGLKQAGNTFKKWIGL